MIPRHLLSAFALCTAACQPLCPRRDAPTMVTGDPDRMPLLSFNGPPCPSGGPQSTLTLTRTQGSKPPAVEGYFELVVNNPLPRVVWLLFGAMPRNTSAGVQRVDVDGPPVRVWHLGYVDALRLTPGATITIRNWRWSVVPHTEAAFTFASEVRLGGVPVETWLGKAGLTTGGELDQNVLTAASYYIRHVGPDREAAELKLDVLCTDIRDVGAAGLPKEE